MTKTILPLLFITLIFAFSGKAQTPTPTPPIIPAVIPIPAPTIPPAKVRWNFDEKNASEAEARLKKIPDAQQTRDDVILRIELIEYYDRQDKPEAKKARQAHRLWLIRNHPETMYYRELGWWTDKDALKDTDYIALKEEWLRQISLKKTNEKIRLSAAHFLSSIDEALAEKILKEGQQINPNVYEYSEQLMSIYQSQVSAAIYAYETKKEGGSDADIDVALKKVLAEGEKALAIISKDEARDRSNDHLDMLAQLAAAALDLNDLKKARAFSETILNGTKGELSAQWFSTDKAIFYGNNLMGRVTLREGSTPKAREHLLASITFPDESDFDLETLEALEMDLAAELLAKGEKQVVLDYLARLEELTKDDDHIKVFRRWQRLIRRNSFPYWQGERF